MLGKLLVMAAASAAGVLLAVQPAINAELARRAGSAFSAAMGSLAISALLLAPVVFALRGTAGFTGLLGWPLWVYHGGTGGAMFVTTGIAGVPLTGLVTYVACVVVGQAVGAILIDQFGLFAMARRPVGLDRMAGLGLILVGLVLVLRGR